MAHFFSQVYEELKQGHDLCLATIVKRSGSAPRSTGASMLVHKNGAIRGTIGGGKLEGDVTKLALKALAERKAQLLHFSLEGKDVSDSEMLCGGNVDVYLEPIFAKDQASQNIFKNASQVVKRGGQALMITHIKPGNIDTLAKRKMLVVKGMEPQGSIEGYNKDSVAKLEPRLDILTKERAFGLYDLEIENGDNISCLWEAITTEPTVYLFGGGHVSLQVANLVKMVGFKLVVMDDRHEFANFDRFPFADDIWVTDYETVLKDKELGQDDYVVILTRGHLFDKEVLGQVLSQNPYYVGMIGSRRKRLAIYKALEEEGVKKERLAWVHSPIGLEIKAETPEEIAVSIVAELIAIRAAS